MNNPPIKKIVYAAQEQRQFQEGLRRKQVEQKRIKRIEASSPGGKPPSLRRATLVRK